MGAALKVISLILGLLFAITVYAQAPTGPRPYIDVTAFGAVGDNIHDDTTAIQAAINQFCNNQTLSSGGSIYFPAGTYKISQPQTPSTSPVFTICTGIHMFGGNSALHEVPGFETSPNVTLSVSPGINPNAAPVFQCIFPQCGGGVTLEFLTINAYNQAIYINQASINKFIGVNLSTYSGITGMVDNTPLKICNSAWNWYEYGTIGTNGATSIPAVLLCSDSTPGNFQQVILTYFENTILDNGTFAYRGGVQNQSVAPGFLVFRNVTTEGTTQPFFSVTETTPGYLGGISNVTFDNIQTADSQAAPMVEWNATSTLSGVFIKSAGAGKSLIQMDQGHVNEVFATSNGAEDSNVQVVDSNGNPFGNVVTQNWSGFDYIVDTSFTNRLRSDTKNLFSTLDTGGFTGPPMRLTPSGSAFATVAVDPVGMFFGDGKSYGFGVYMGETSANTLDLNFSRLLPPTNVSGTAMTGGSLPPGTYYYYLTSTDTAGMCGESAPSIVSSGVVVSSPNNAVHVSWTAPQTSIGTINSYCLFRSLVSPGSVTDPSSLAQVVIGTDFTDNGGGVGGENSVTTPTYVPRHRFTQSALGINTTSPATALDVNGTATIRGYLNQGSANQWAGNCTIGKSCSITFKVPYNSYPVCIGTDQVTESVVKAVPTKIGVNFEGKAGDTIGYICVGNPN